MDRRELLAASGVLLGAVAGCLSSAEGESGVPAPGVGIGADVDRADVDELVEANTAFALDVHEAIVDAGPEENHVVSPLSLSIALAMTWAGARGETEAQMAGALSVPSDHSAVHPAMGGLLTALDERARGAGDEGFLEGLFGDGGDALELAIANRLWPREGLDVREDFLETVAENYAAEPRQLDFAGDPDGSRAEINDWVADRTDGLIDEVLPEGSIAPETALVLTNAIYFLADWAQQFDPDDTTDEPFTALDGSIERVPTMSQTEEFPYASADGHQVVELPYAGEQVSMVVVLPAEGEFESFEASLTVDALSDLLDDLEEGEVALSLPRFEFEAGYRLRPILEELGMPAAFAGGFDGIVEGGDLRIDDVYHDAVVAVDESGTEAAAATAVSMNDSAPPSVTVDRPFLFLIRDRPTDSVLFLGRVVTPPDDPG